MLQTACSEASHLVPVAAADGPSANGACRRAASEPREHIISLLNKDRLLSHVVGSRV